MTAGPGMRVFLDGELVGATSEREDGLFVSDVSRGRHTIRVEKDGFETQSFEVQVVTRPIEIEVADPIPVAPPAPAGEPAAEMTTATEVGSLVVTSAPQNCTVEIDGRVFDKTTPQLSIGGLPLGRHTITFSKDGFQTVTSTITIEAGAESTIHGDLKETRVEVVHDGLGALRVFSKPGRCTIWFRNEMYDKLRGPLNITKIPAGEYPLLITIPGRELSTTVLIADRQRTVVEVSFVKGDEPFVIRRE